MKVFTSPDIIPDKIDLFLAGGISNCPDWQKEILSYFESTDMVIANPRREFYATDTYAQEQIAWEYDALHKSVMVSFWFPEETLCPITLFELGVFTQRKDIHLVVGTHPNYGRKLDVVEQLKLARPEVKVVHSLEDLVFQIKL